MSFLDNYNEKRQNRWYFGGVASAAATCFTHPLDLLKVLLQTQTQKPPLKIMQLVVKILHTEGILGLYNGISAALARQFSFTLLRMGLYEKLKYSIPEKNARLRLALAIGAGISGALAGMPAEVTNVRMQNDMRLPPDQRRNYKHVFDGLSRIVKEEGFLALYKGTTANIVRGTFMTLSTNIVYDQVKYIVLNLGLEDITSTHLLCSVTSAISGTTVGLPIDIIKTRMMNSKPGEYTGIADVVLYTARQGPLTFYRGYIPALTRAIPHVTIMFILMEQMRLYFGILPPTANKNQ